MRPLTEPAEDDGLSTSERAAISKLPVDVDDEVILSCYLQHVRIVAEAGLSWLRRDQFAHAPTDALALNVYIHARVAIGFRAVLLDRWPDLWTPTADRLQAVAVRWSAKVLLDLRRRLKQHARRGVVALGEAEAITSNELEALKAAVALAEATRDAGPVKQALIEALEDDRITGSASYLLQVLGKSRGGGVKHLEDLRDVGAIEFGELDRPIGRERFWMRVFDPALRSKAIANHEREQQLKAQRKTTKRRPNVK